MVAGLSGTEHENRAKPCANPSLPACFQLRLGVIQCTNQKTGLKRDKNVTLFRIVGFFCDMYSSKRWRGVEKIWDFSWEWKKRACSHCVHAGGNTKAWCGGQAPGHEAAATVHGRVGHVHAVHLAQFWPGTLAGFRNALRHPIEVFQGGLARKQRGCLGEDAKRRWERHM